ncbi:alpha/beta fold hydrolase [Streptomyces gilvosporeus]|uniref:Alpha/beta hydrolase n=1 Tax=Streptomyces gilvosporeus TaxID=553510 RepID=A0A1V0TU77_9ACTN|nr:alpha/beta hydrolase [Streptomyces gilvosporeus]ARF56514.1 alpha/beta hydrolase [Streptomyces gilvosporeus]
MPYINVDGEDGPAVELHYEDQGAGVPVVLLHGYLLDGRSWARQTAALLAAGFRVISYDRRGFGKSSRPQAGYDYDTLAGDLHTVMTTLDLTDVALVGFSMGTGDIARYLNVHGSGRVARAGFLAPLGPYLLKTGDTPSGVDAALIDQVLAAVEEDREGYLNGFFHDLYNLDETLGSRIGEAEVRAARAAARRVPTHVCLRAVPTCGTDFRRDIQAIDVPTLIVHGTADRVLPVAAAARPMRAMLPSARYVEIDDAPHGLLWTHADEVNRHLLEFLVS